MSEVTLHEVNLRDILPEFAELCKEHWDEIALHRDEIPLDPDWNRYLTLDMTGLLSVVAAKDQAGKLVGYSVFLVMPHLHYNSTLCGMNDVVFLKKEFRNQGVGKQLLQRAEQCLLARGVKKISWHVKEHYNFGPILERMGYECEEKNWGKCMRGAK